MKIGHMISETNQRLGLQVQAPERLSVSQKFGVIPSSTLESRGMQPNNLDRYKIVMAGDLVLNRFNAYKGALGVAPKTGIVSPDYFTARTLPGVSNARYLDYFIRSDPVADLIKRDMSGMGSADPDSSAFSRFDVQAFLSIKTPGFNLPTQRRIADYLDRETAQIDAMAEALDGLVARLEERRVAAIENATHALSESSDGIPHGWVFIPFKWAVEAHFPGDWGGDPGTNDTDRLCVRVADFDRTSGTVGGDVPTLRSYTTRSANERHLRTHDLLLEKSGGTPKNPVGRVVLYTGRPGRMTTNFVQCIRLNADHESRFWHYVFLAAYKTRFTNVHVRQTTGIQNLDIGGFFDEKFACPPLDEQRRIADHLDAETAKIDAMIAKAGKLRVLLDERRSALITATVTGQHPVPEEP